MPGPGGGGQGGGFGGPGGGGGPGGPGGGGYHGGPGGPGGHRGGPPPRRSPCFCGCCLPMLGIIASIAALVALFVVIL